MSFFFSFCFFTNPRCHAKRKAYKTSWFDLSFIEIFVLRVQKITWKNIHITKNFIIFQEVEATITIHKHLQ